MSRIMDLHSRAVGARSMRPTLHTRSEQAENSFTSHQAAAIRHPSATSASISARQTIFTGRSSRLPAWKADSVLMSGGTTSLRMSYAFTPAETTKAPVLPGPLKPRRSLLGG